MIEYTKRAAFINRVAELESLKDSVSKQPENILFIYGPKSSGKTTLIYKFVDELKKDSLQKYDIKHFNLRTILLGNYEDFLRAFFGAELTENERNDVTTRTAELNLNIFRLSTQTMASLKGKNVDPFAVMQAELERMNQSGIRPIIIIDELQALEGIYLNGQRELLKEMFNFFVAMTKESHLCHVLIASSDGYFIERIYNDSKLKKTSAFMSVDYLTEEDTYYWLNNLERESGMKNFALSESQKDELWNVLGGSCWEVSHILGDLQDSAVDGKVPPEPFDKILQKYKVMQRSRFYDYARLYKDKIAMFVRMAEVVAQQTSFAFSDFAELVERKTISMEKLEKEIAELVRQNVLAYNPTTSEFSLQGRSMEVGLAMYVEMIKKTS